MKYCTICGKEFPDDVDTCDSCKYRFDSIAINGETEPLSDKTTVFSPGSIIGGRYQVIKLIGQGGMGSVFLVHDTMLKDQKNVLKVIHPRLVKNLEALQRFIDEVIICQKLNHPNIIKVFHLDRIDNFHFFTMEFVDGISLREWFNRLKDKKPPFSLTETLSVIHLLLDALSYAHHFMIHRDIKPENIIILGDFPDIRVKILDFGIAKTLSPSKFIQMAQTMGTAYYIAPEQMNGVKNIDHRSDLYSVGMIFYEMLTGEKAVGRFSLPTEFIHGLPAEIDSIVTTALAPRADGRYSSAEEMKKALEEVPLSGERDEKPETISSYAVEASPKSFLPEKELPQKPRKTIAPAILILLALIVVCFFGF